MTVRNWQLRHGGFFTERDITSAAKVCVIGRTVVAKLFQTTNPLNTVIRIRNITIVQSRSGQRQSGQGLPGCHHLAATAA
ncbi:MAG: ABC transporter permease [Pirellulales bacterium]